MNRNPLRATANERFLEKLRLRALPAPLGAEQDGRLLFHVTILADIQKNSISPRDRAHEVLNLLLRPGKLPLAALHRVVGFRAERALALEAHAPRLELL